MPSSTSSTSLPSGSFILQDPPVSATVSEVGKWHYWLQISGQDKVWANTACTTRRLNVGSGNEAGVYAGNLPSFLILFISFLLGGKRRVLATEFWSRQDVWRDQPAITDINPVFNFEYLSFVFNHCTEDGSAYYWWVLRFKDQELRGKRGGDGLGMENPRYVP